MSDIHTPEKIQELPSAVIKSMIALATSGFGVVVALAWNQFVQHLVDQYINPYLGNNSGLLSLFIYASTMTFLAVFVTMQLTGLQRKIEIVEARQKEKKEMAEAKMAEAKRKC